MSDNYQVDHKMVRDFGSDRIVYTSENHCWKDWMKLCEDRGYTKPGYALTRVDIWRDEAQLSFRKTKNEQ